MKDALRPAPDGVDEPLGEATAALLENATMALEVVVSSVVILLLVGTAAWTVAVVVAVDDSRCNEPFDRPPCLQWPALTTTAYARKKRKRMMLVVW